MRPPRASPQVIVDQHRKSSWPDRVLPYPGFSPGPDTRLCGSLTLRSASNSYGTVGTRGVEPPLEAV